MAATSKADAWLAQQTEKTRAARAALHRIYADPNAIKTHRSRTPNAIEQAATERPGDRYEPTPTGPGNARPISEVDPTAAAVFKWEASVQQAATRIADAAEQIHRHAQTAATKPGISKPTSPPDTPPTRVTATGHTIVNAGPIRSLAYADGALGWITATLPILAELIRGSHPDVTETWQTATLLTKLDVSLGVRMCRCDDSCGLPAPERGKGRTRPACRQRTSRRNRKTKGTNTDRRHTDVTVR